MGGTRNRNKAIQDRAGWASPALDCIESTGVMLCVGPRHPGVLIGPVVADLKYLSSKEIRYLLARAYLCESRPGACRSGQRGARRVLTGRPSARASRPPGASLPPLKSGRRGSPGRCPSRARIAYKSRYPADLLACDDFAGFISGVSVGLTHEQNKHAPVSPLDFHCVTFFRWPAPVSCNLF